MNVVFLFSATIILITKDFSAVVNSDRFEYMQSLNSTPKNMYTKETQKVGLSPLPEVFSLPFIPV